MSNQYRASTTGNILSGKREGRGEREGQVSRQAYLELSYAWERGRDRGEIQRYRELERHRDRGDNKNPEQSRVAQLESNNK